MLPLVIVLTLIALGAGGFYISKEAAYLSWEEFLGNIGLGVSLFGLAGFAIGLAFYTQAAYKKDIINREFHTTYTQAEVFFASDVIETIRQIQRQRVEINGDLLKDK